MFFYTLLRTILFAYPIPALLVMVPVVRTGTARSLKQTRKQPLALITRSLVVILMDYMQVFSPLTLN
jgi:hypothetical protein